MSDAPISELEASSLEVLERSGWSNAELIWEQIQESAAQCNQAGDTQEASEMWAGALEVAEQYFAPNDLRLATSISNRALALRRDGDLDTAKRLFDRSLAIWSTPDDWLANLRPDHRARSSTFHFRLQTKHPGGYDRFSLERYQALAAEGHSVVVRVAQGEAVDGQRQKRWRNEKPQRFTDARKLLAAVLLIATR